MIYRLLAAMVRVASLPQVDPEQAALRRMAVEIAQLETPPSYVGRVTGAPAT